MSGNEQINDKEEMSDKEMNDKEMEIEKERKKEQREIEKELKEIRRIETAMNEVRDKKENEENTNSSSKPSAQIPYSPNLYKNVVPTKSKKARYVAKKQRAKPRQWSEREERTFRAGIGLYGRDWKRISEMEGIDNRSVDLVRSHAQKWLIVQWKRNISLPEICRTIHGNGYTLSGKPLDPKSGAAMMYARQCGKRKKNTKNGQNDTLRPIVRRQKGPWYKGLMHKSPQHYYSNGKLIRKSIFSSEGIKKHCQQFTGRRIIGMSYSQPMEIEGWKSENDATKRLAPLLIRPHNIRMLQHNIGDTATFKTWFDKLWFTPKNELKAMIKKYQSYGRRRIATPFDIYVPPSHLIDDIDIDIDKKLELRSGPTSIPKVSICWHQHVDIKSDINHHQRGRGRDAKCNFPVADNNYFEWDDIYNGDKTRDWRFVHDLNCKFIPEQYQCQALPDIDEQLLHNRRFHVVSFDISDLSTFESNQLMKKWALTNKLLRKELLSEYDGRYMVVSNISDIFDQWINSGRRTTFFFVHFKFHPLIGIQCFGDNGIDAIAQHCNVILSIRFINGAAYLTKEQKATNKKIKQLRKKGEILMKEVGGQQIEIININHSHDVDVDVDVDVDGDVASDASDYTKDMAIARYQEKAKMYKRKARKYKKKWKRTKNKENHHHIIDTKDDDNDDDDDDDDDESTDNDVDDNDNLKRVHSNDDDEDNLDPSTKRQKLNDLSIKRRGKGGAAPFRCVDCDVRFYEEYKFDQHNKENHLEDIDSDDIGYDGDVKIVDKSNKNNNDKSFECQECDKSFKTENGLNIHRGRIHKNGKKGIKRIKNKTRSKKGKESKKDKEESMKTKKSSKYKPIDFVEKAIDETLQSLSIQNFNNSAIRIPSNESVPIEQIPSIPSVPTIPFIPSSHMLPTFNRNNNNNTNLPIELFEKWQDGKQVDGSQSNPINLTDSASNKNNNNINTMHQSQSNTNRKTKTNTKSPTKCKKKDSKKESKKVCGTKSRYSRIKNVEMEEMKEVSSKRYNVRSEWLIGHEIFKSSSRFELSLLNSVAHYFGLELVKILKKKEKKTKVPFYHIHTRDTFNESLAFVSEQQTVKDRTFTKKEYYLKSNGNTCRKYINWMRQKYIGIYGDDDKKTKIKPSKYRNVDRLIINGDDISSESDAEQERKNNDKYNTNQIEDDSSDDQLDAAISVSSFKKRLKDKGVPSNVVDEQVDKLEKMENEKALKAKTRRNSKMEDDSATEDEDDDIVMNNNNNNIIDGPWDHISDGLIRDRIIGGEKCNYIGAAAYPDIFTEKELKEMETTLDDLQERSEANQFLRGTSQQSVRSGVLVRTKHFFGARYLWHPTEIRAAGKDAKIGRGLRCDVEEVPDCLWTLCEEKLVKYGIIKRDFIEGIAFNMYHDGTEGIGPHFDDRDRFDRPIITIRLFSDARIAFGTDLYGTTNGTFAIALPRGTVFVLAKDSFIADGIKHTIRVNDMYMKSAAIILRRFNEIALKQAKSYQAMLKLIDSDHDHGEEEKKEDKKQEDKKYKKWREVRGVVVYDRGGNKGGGGGSKGDDVNKYEMNDFVVADDDEIEYYDDYKGVKRRIKKINKNASYGEDGDVNQQKAMIAWYNKQRELKHDEKEKEKEKEQHNNNNNNDHNHNKKMDVENNNVSVSDKMRSNDMETAINQID